MMNIDEALQDVQLLKDMLKLARVRASDGAPFFLIWGALWLAAYLLPWLGVPNTWVWPLWLAFDALGALASMLVGVRLRKHLGAVPYLVRQWYWSALVLLGFGAGASLLFTSGTSAPAEPSFFIWPLALGAWYVLGGVLFGSRIFLVLGVWIGALSVAIPYLPMAPAMQQAAMGVLGGGAVLASGLWLLRSVHHE